MKKWVLTGCLALMIIGGAVLVLTAEEGVFRCSWFVGVCQGQCYCTGENSEIIGLCAFQCDDGSGGTCSAFSWPYTCTPIDP